MAGVNQLKNIVRKKFIFFVIYLNIIGGDPFRLPMSIILFLDLLNCLLGESC